MGVDVERIPYNGPCLELADRYFSPSEAKAIRALPPSEQPMRFIEYWVLKESFTKAQGMGLTIPLNTFSFHKIKTRGSEIEIRFSPSYEDEGLLWQFNLNAIGDKHVAATAIERSEGEALCLSRYEWTPPLDVNIGHARMGTPSKRHQSA